MACTWPPRRLSHIGDDCKALLRSTSPAQPSYICMHASKSLLGSMTSNFLKSSLTPLCLSGVKRMARDPRWMQGEVIESSSLLPQASRGSGREVKLIKLKMLQSNASYEPGLPPAPASAPCSGRAVRTGGVVYTAAAV